MKINCISCFSEKTPCIPSQAAGKKLMQTSPGLLGYEKHMQI